MFSLERLEDRLAPATFQIPDPAGIASTNLLTGTESGTLTELIRGSNLADGNFPTPIGQVEDLNGSIVDTRVERFVADETGLFGGTTDKNLSIRLTPTTVIPADQQATSNAVVGSISNINAVAIGESLTVLIAPGPGEVFGQPVTVRLGAILDATFAAPLDGVSHTGGFTVTVDPGDGPRILLNQTFNAFDANGQDTTVTDSFETTVGRSFQLSFRATSDVSVTTSRGSALSLPASFTVGMTMTEPGPPPVTDQAFAVGVGSGTAPSVALHNLDGSERFRVEAFASTFTGGVRTASAELTGDGIAELIVGTGPGSPTQIRVFDGNTREVVRTIDVFEPAFTGGLYVSAGDVNGDGIADIAVTPDEGGGPRVRIFSGTDGFLLADFFGIDDPNFRGGARTALADLNGDDRADLLVAAGFGGGPRLAGYDGTSLGGSAVKLFADFFIFEQGLRNGAFIAGGDVNGDGMADVIAGGGPGGGPRVFGLSGRELLAGQNVQVANFFAGDTSSRGGIRVVVRELDGDNRAEIIVGAGTGAGSRVTAYRGADIAPSGTPPELFAFDAFNPAPAGGVFVG